MLDDGGRGGIKDLDLVKVISQVGSRLFGIGEGGRNDHLLQPHTPAQPGLPGVGPVRFAGIEPEVKRLSRTPSGKEIRERRHPIARVPGAPGRISDDDRAGRIVHSPRFRQVAGTPALAGVTDEVAGFLQPVRVDGELGRQGSPQENTGLQHPGMHPGKHRRA